MAGRKESRRATKDRQAKKIARLEKRIRRLRQELKQARKNHRPRKSIRAHLTTALRARRLREAVTRPQRAITKTERAEKPEHFKRIKTAKVVEGGTRKLPKLKKQHRKHKQRRKRAHKIYRVRPQFVETIFSKNYPDSSGEFIRLTAPLNYQDWLYKLKGLKSDPNIRKLEKDGYKLIYKIGDNLDGVHSTIDTLIAHFNERYAVPNRKYPNGRIPSMNKKQRDQFFEILTIYAVKRFHKGQRKTFRRTNATGRSS